MSYYNIPVDWRTRLGNPLPQVSHPAVISHNILSHTISGLSSIPHNIRPSIQLLSLAVLSKVKACVVITGGRLDAC